MTDEILEYLGEKFVNQEIEKRVGLTFEAYCNEPQEIMDLMDSYIEHEICEYTGADFERYLAWPDVWDMAAERVKNGFGIAIVKTKMGALPVLKGARYAA